MFIILSGDFRDENTVTLLKFLVFYRLRSHVPSPYREHNSVQIVKLDTLKYSNKLTVIKEITTTKIFLKFSRYTGSKIPVIPAYMRNILLLLLRN